LPYCPSSHSFGSSTFGYSPTEPSELRSPRTRTTRRVKFPGILLPSKWQLVQTHLRMLQIGTKSNHWRKPVARGGLALVEIPTAHAVGIPQSLSSSTSLAHASGWVRQTDVMLLIACVLAYRFKNALAYLLSRQHPWRGCHKAGSRIRDRVFDTYYSDFRAIPCPQNPLICLKAS
jgi:hypothetical protein